MQSCITDLIVINENKKRRKKLNSNKKTARIKVKKNNLQIEFIILSLIFLFENSFAKSNEWDTEITDDGKITVKSNISERIDEKGEKVQLIEYIASTTTNVSMQNCISVIKDVSIHKEFTDDEVSKMVKTISDNEWVVYYYTDAPWPMPDNDCVAKMSFSEDATEKKATFTLTAAPSSFENKDVDRMTYYNVSYAFKNLGNGEIEITVSGEMSPIVQVPGWMVSAWFPDGPADILRIITKLAENN